MAAPDPRVPGRPASSEARDEPGRVLDRDDLDRVIRRAVELQFQQGDAADGQALTEEEVLRIGREVGVEEGHVRRALGELRAEALIPARARDHPFVERYLGPGIVQASRVVPGDAREVESKLAEHFRVGESLTRIRSRQGRSHWEPAEGMLAELQRGVRWKGYRYDLARARSVKLTVASLEDGFTLVTMSGDLRGHRAENVFGGAVAGGGVGAALGWGGGFLLAGGWIVAAPGALVGCAVAAWLGRREHHKELRRLQLAMEGILDRLEAGEPLARKSAGILGHGAERPPLPPKGTAP